MSNDRERYMSLYPKAYAALKAAYPKADANHLSAVAAWAYSKSHVRVDEWGKTVFHDDAWTYAPCVFPQPKIGHPHYDEYEARIMRTPNEMMAIEERKGTSEYLNDWMQSEGSDFASALDMYDRVYTATMTATGGNTIEATKQAQAACRGETDE